jgi:hypothetical protein
MPVASIESPYFGLTPVLQRRNTRYAMLASQWAVQHGYAPYASHLIQTSHCLHDEDHGSPYVADHGAGQHAAPHTIGAADADRYTVVGRDAAIALSHEVRRKMDIALFFVDFGESSGMKAARAVFIEAGIPILEIRLADDPKFADLPTGAPSVTSKPAGPDRFSVVVHDGAVNIDLLLEVTGPGAARIKSAICTVRTPGVTAQSELTDCCAVHDDGEVRITDAHSPGGFMVWDGDHQLGNALEAVGCRVPRIAH